MSDLYAKAKAQRKEVLEEERPVKSTPKPAPKPKPKPKPKPTPKKETEEKYELQIIDDYKDIQEITEFKHIPSKQLILEAVEMHRFLAKSIIKDSDFHKIGKGRFLKRSGFRKIAQAFGVTSEQIGKEELFERDGILHARVKVRASLNNIDPKAIEIGMKLLIESNKLSPEEVIRIIQEISKVRYAEGLGVVSMEEIKFGKNKTVHNLIAYAYTRAESRAIADVVGFGVVSATEVDVNSDEEVSMF
jgi:hypothetical protein